MLIFDAHLDLAFNAIDWNRDLRMDLAEIRGQEGTLKVTWPGRGNSTVSFPELRKGGVGLGVATLFARVEAAINHPFGRTTPEACYAVAMSHQGLPGLFLGHLLGGEAAQLVVDQRQQLGAGLRVWLPPAGLVPGMPLDEIDVYHPRPSPRNAAGDAFYFKPHPRFKSSRPYYS